MEPLCACLCVSLSLLLYSLNLSHKFDYAVMQCIRCLRQTSAFTSPGATNPHNQNDREAWWISRWAFGCPMCGGTWVRVV